MQATTDPKHVRRLAAEHGINLSDDNGSIHMRQDDYQVTIARFLVRGESLAVVEVSAPIRFVKDATAILDAYAGALRTNIDRQNAVASPPKKRGPTAANV